MVACEFRSISAGFCVPVLALLEFLKRLDSPLVVVDHNNLLKEEVGNYAVQLVIRNTDHLVILVDVGKDVAAVEGRDWFGSNRREINTLAGAVNIVRLVRADA